MSATLLSPGTRRELIRLANRDRFNSTEVTALLEYSQYMMDMSGQPEDSPGITDALIESWKASFEE